MGRRSAAVAIALAVAAAGSGYGQEAGARGKPVPGGAAITHVESAAAVGAALRSGASSIVIGRSVRGRPLRAERIGSARAPVTLLVAGPLHGNEPAGKQVIARLRGARPPAGTALWLIPDPNPDGAAAGTRQNAHGVDLNRNFPFRWQADGHAFDTYHSGSGPLSEPESRALASFVERLRPRVTLWYHQALRIVVRSGGDQKLQRLYARRGGLPWRSLPAYHGTVSSWQNHRFRGGTAFVVELPAGRLPAAGVRRHAGAVLALARAGSRPGVARPEHDDVGARAPEVAGRAGHQPGAQALAAGAPGDRARTVHAPHAIVSAPHGRRRHHHR
ncbi:MAG TPA: M14 family zinc carboxypeptidase [Thermoleophilaceae bacterium]